MINLLYYKFYLSSIKLSHTSFILSNSKPVVLNVLIPKEAATSLFFSLSSINRISSGLNGTLSKTYLNISTFGFLSPISNDRKT